MDLRGLIAVCKYLSVWPTQLLDLLLAVRQPFNEQQLLQNLVASYCHLSKTGELLADYQLPIYMTDYSSSNPLKVNP